VRSDRTGRSGEKETAMTLLTELAHRHQDGLEVTLLWDAQAHTISIDLLDDRSETALRFEVDPRSALDAFYHPFVYAPALEPDFDDAALAALEL
jgi:YD repeat-containing protein